MMRQPNLRLLTTHQALLRQLPINFFSHIATVAARCAADHRPRSWPTRCALVSSGLDLVLGEAGLGAGEAGDGGHVHVEGGVGLALLAVASPAVAALAHGGVVLKGGGLRAGDALPHAVLVALAAGGGALGPVTIDGGRTAGGNRLVVDGLYGGGALFAAVGGVGGNAAGAAELALATGEGGVRGPGGDDAVSGAGSGGAGTDVDERRAGEATVLGELEDGAGALLGAVAAGLGAAAEGAPLANVAVDGAVGGAALAGGGGGGAALAAVLGLLVDGAGALLGAGAAGLGALGPVGPVADLAVGGAGLGVALLHLLHVLAVLAAVEGTGDVVTDTDAVATAAGAGADAPGVEAARLAVHGALALVAVALELEGGALVAEAVGA